MKRDHPPAPRSAEVNDTADDSATQQSRMPSVRPGPGSRTSNREPDRPRHEHQRRSGCSRLVHRWRCSPSYRWHLLLTTVHGPAGRHLRSMIFAVAAHAVGVRGLGRCSDRPRTRRRRRSAAAAECDCRAVTDPYPNQEVHDGAKEPHHLRTPGARSDSASKRRASTRTASPSCSSARCATSRCERAVEGTPKTSATWRTRCRSSISSATRQSAYERRVVAATRIPEAAMG